MIIYIVLLCRQDQCVADLSFSGYHNDSTLQVEIQSCGRGNITRDGFGLAHAVQQTQDVQPSLFQKLSIHLKYQHGQITVIQRERAKLRTGRSYTVLKSGGRCVHPISLCIQGKAYGTGLGVYARLLPSSFLDPQHLQYQWSSVLGWFLQRTQAMDYELGLLKTLRPAWPVLRSHAMDLDQRPQLL